MQRFFAVFIARNLEFLRDRSSLGWNILLPVLLVAGLGLIFAGPERPLFKIAVLDDATTVDQTAHPFLETQYTQFFTVADREGTIEKVSRHQIDMLVDLGSARYWVNPDSPKGYMLEKILRGSGGNALEKAIVEGDRIRYIDWLLPGILGMNMMFSCLFGVGYVVVRYRKNGFLKRLNATPLRSVEFIGAQMTSRLILIMTITVVVFIGTDLFVGFRMEGGRFSLLVTATLGAVAMISLGLLISARVTSEELAGGLLNLITWPMMLLSGVWFSMEGTHPWLQQAANGLPLTHMLEAARAIMLDGAGLADVAPNLLALASMSLLFLVLGAALFRWKLD